MALKICKDCPETGVTMVICGVRPHMASEIFDMFDIFRILGKSVNGIFSFYGLCPSQCQWHCLEPRGLLGLDVLVVQMYGPWDILGFFCNHFGQSNQVKWNLFCDILCDH